MSETNHGALIDRLEDRVGDGLKTVTRFTEDESDVFYGADWFERIVAEVDTRSPEKMHRDAVYQLQQADIGSELYGSRIKSDIQVNEHGTGIALYPKSDVGFYVWIDEEASVEVPDVVDDCLDALEESA
ncbi:hypothetical protein [Halosimplex salinum]|uniref:hypothetical protein n=1 Tax=Halosimplex salinum TaxID=1710538 RepID=UPI000F49FFDC|nr:hypothetical protein [Halosimplex salinum]